MSSGPVSTNLKEPEKVKISRMPSSGFTFEFCGILFEVIKSQGRTFKAKNKKSKKITLKKMFKHGNLFTLSGTRFRVLNDFMMTSGIVRLSAVVHDEDEDKNDPTKLN